MMSLASPKSQILATRRSVNRTFLAATSLWMHWSEDPADSEHSNIFWKSQENIIWMTSCCHCPIGTHVFSCEEVKSFWHLVGEFEEVVHVQRPWIFILILQRWIWITRATSWMIFLKLNLKLSSSTIKIVERVVLWLTLKRFCKCRCCGSHVQIMTRAGAGNPTVTVTKKWNIHSCITKHVFNSVCVCCQYCNVWLLTWFWRN